ncbi:MAG: Asp-tRNA(Asn)/Glu-tRNA(Gln) amidotransferase subunit GatA [Phycisphaerales bacterium]|jgi:aspartyl-tRNA(Asn)/glutamyl-tRNA(Gln) amidotransferase subunit A|nr:Asp-tRNA(Asn)/Glu-tRNA(Gln) amidotransferase subunit GatA [Phycisphaerales bacterium]
MSTIPETAREIAAAVRSGGVSAVDVAEHYLGRIAALDAHLGCFQDVRAETARSMAARIDALIARGEDPGPLAGVPVALKDNIMVAGAPATCGSRILENFISPYDATVTRRLTAAGAVLLGRTRCDEFAMGSSTEHCAFGVVRNPWDPEYVPGGSSGGSAAAVAAGLVPCALGSDTGGSIRQPAAFCGVTGLKPTGGRVSRWGLVSFAPSMDQIGPFTRDAADAALLLQVLAGEDPHDDTSAASEAPGGMDAIERPLDGLRIGIPQEHLSDNNDAAINAAVQNAADVYRSLGCDVSTVHLETTDLGVACYCVLGPAEASSNLARFDGIRYGRRAAGADADLEQTYSASRSEGLGMEVRRRIMLGTYVLSAGYYDAYYTRALKVRRLIHDEYARLFTQVDVILGPTVPSPPFRFGAHSDPLSMYLCDKYTVTANIAGTCGVAIPAGTTNVDGSSLPVSIQLQGPVLGEDTVLRAAHHFQIATAHHTAQPPLTAAT